MKLFKTKIWLIILIEFCSIISSYCEQRKLPFLNKLIPWIEGKNFAQTFYLNSRISLIPLDTSVQSDSNETIFNQLQINGSSDLFQHSPISLCAVHLQVIITKLWSNQHDIFLLSFIDSFAKPVAGIRNGNLNWYGNQMQCESTNISMNPSDADSSSFGGKYCRVEWNTQLTSQQSLNHYTEVCVPNSCSSGDFDHLKIFLEKFFFLKLSDSSYVSEISCKEEHETGETTLVFYCICIILLALGILSTFYQYFTQRTGSKKNFVDSRVSFLGSFSIPQGLRSLNGDCVSRNDILIIHYIRGSCAIILVLVHLVLDLADFALNPDIWLNLLPQTPKIWMFLRSIMAVFFFLTGFLIHSDYTGSNLNFNPFRSILKTFVRLSPSYYFSILTQTAFASKFGLGSDLKFGPTCIDRSVCSKFYPQLFLYNYNRLPFVEMVSK